MIIQTLDVASNDHFSWFSFDTPGKLHVVHGVRALTPLNATGIQGILQIYNLLLYKPTTWQ